MKNLEAFGARQKGAISLGWSFIFGGDGGSRTRVQIGQPKLLQV